MTDNNLKQLLKVAIGDGNIINEQYRYKKTIIDQSNHDFVKEFFELDYISPADYDALYQQATTGDGNEDPNMDKIISSALWAFLFFSAVSEHNPLTIDRVKYTNVCFEFKNKTLKGNTKPSNIDVVLTDTNKDHILFIESKFGEYVYNTSTSYAISNQYAQTEPTKTLLMQLAKEGIVQDGIFSDEGNKRYFEGIKQMTTHINGLYNFCRGNFCDKNNADERKVEIEQSMLREKQLEVYLKEIVFDFADFGLGKTELEDYLDLQEKVHSRFCNEYGFSLKKIQTYQDIYKDEKNKNYTLSKRICDIYRLKK